MRAARASISSLLFLKLADEMNDLGDKVAAASCRSLGSKKQRQDASVTFIFLKARNKISTPSDLQRVIKMIGDEGDRIVEDVEEIQVCLSRLHLGVGDGKFRKGDG